MCFKLVRQIGTFSFTMITTLLQAHLIFSHLMPNHRWHETQIHSFRKTITHIRSSLPQSTLLFTQPGIITLLILVPRLAEMPIPTCLSISELPQAIHGLIIFTYLSN